MANLGRCGALALDALPKSSTTKVLLRVKAHKEQHAIARLHARRPTHETKYQSYARQSCAASLDSPVERARVSESDKRVTRE